MNPPTLLRAVLPLLLALATACANAQPAAPPAAPATGETVLWHINNFPPYSITSGPNEGQGINDQAMALLIRDMPEFQHKIVDAALPRVIDTIKTRPNGCSVSLLSTPEREAVMQFSNPRSLVLPNGLVVLRKRAAEFAPYLNPRGELVLDRMLGDGRLKIGLSSDRSYGAPIDRLIRHHAAAIVQIAAKDQFAARLLKLANQNEFDAILGYAIELKYTTRELQLDLADFAIYPLAESPGLLALGVACSRSPQGDRIIHAINRVLADKAVRRQMDAQYRAWLDKDSAAYYDRLLKQRQAGPGEKGAAP